MSQSPTTVPNSRLPTLVVFCKRPKLNQGKQRLVEDISAEQALNVAQGLLACAIEDTLSWQGPVVIACAHDSDKDWAKTLNPQAEIMTQLPENTSGNLGQRLNHVDQRLRQLGHEQLIIIGTDAPILTSDYFTKTALALSEHDIVLSHADDGGVVIMANSTPWPNLFALPWSTDKLSHALSTHCRDNDLSVNYIEPGYDIDYVQDLQKLAGDLSGDLRPARQALLNIIYPIFTSLGVTSNA